MMEILNHFQHLKLTENQRYALIKISEFLESDSSIFMLKGYAGTGKTTLLKGITDYLRACNRQYQLMAPTGRAAKILRSKTGSGSTIHKTIYELERYDFIKKNDKNSPDENYKLIFPIKNLTHDKIVFFVDEASMVSSVASVHPILQFGTDSLLQDLLTYSKIPLSKNKIIFIGDPAQLPPVGDKESKALMQEYFEEKGLTVEEIELTEVKRQSDGLILKNATLIRNKILEENPTILKLEYDESTFVKLETQDIVSTYINSNPVPEINSGVIISFSNRQCYQNNTAVREIYFPGNGSVQSGDIIQIVSNNYKTYPTELYNGDFAKVIHVDPSTTTITAPVYTSIAGDIVKKNISLDFRKITIKLDTFDIPFDCLIIDSMLNSFSGELTVEEHKAIYINFIMRFDKEQNKRMEKGLPVYKRYSKEFTDMLQSDPYLNAVRCKYGYAITCHKAQGGEWKKVIVDYSGKVSLKKEPLRWAYTATTRATDTCYAVNAPYFDTFSKFSFNPISVFTNIPKEAYDYYDVPATPWHDKTSNGGKRVKFWEILEKLGETNFNIVDVFSREYLERYTLSDGEVNIVIEGHHNQAGVFLKGFSLSSESTEESKKIEELFNAQRITFTPLSYKPSQSFLAELYSFIQESCLELDIVITNVEEKVKQNFVNYYFRTDNICSIIQFYFNKEGHFTTALPRTYNCKQDQKLELLISHILDHVI